MTNDRVKEVLEREMGEKVSESILINADLFRELIYIIVATLNIFYFKFLFPDVSQVLPGSLHYPTVSMHDDWFLPSKKQPPQNHSRLNWVRTRLTQLKFKRGQELNLSLSLVSI